MRIRGCSCCLVCQVQWGPPLTCDTKFLWLLWRESSIWPRLALAASMLWLSEYFWILASRAAIMSKLLPTMWCVRLGSRRDHPWWPQCPVLEVSKRSLCVASIHLHSPCAAANRSDDGIPGYEAMLKLVVDGLWQPAPIAAAPPASPDSLWEAAFTTPGRTASIGILAFFLLLWAQVK